MTRGGSLSFGLLLLHLPLAGAAQLARHVLPSCRLSLRVLRVNQLPCADDAALCRGGSALSVASLRDALECVSPGCPTRSRSVRCVICVGDADGFRRRQSNTKRQTGLLSPRSVGVVTLRRRQDFLPFFSTLLFPRQHVGEGAGGGYHRVAFLGDRRVTSVSQGGWERRRWGGRGSPSFSPASVDHKLPGNDFYEGPNKSRAVDSV